MSGESYNQTILLDANRLSSEEYSASNLAQTDNAIFTNRVSSGITLNVGDQISIESAHIAQRGAGGSVIQFDGDIIGQKTIVETETTNSSFIGYTIQDGDITYSPTGYAYETSENVSKKIDVKDNQASVVFEYYKTTNGENNMGLPRNFGSASMGSSVHGGDPTGANASFWVAKDSYAKGLNTYYVKPSHVFTPDYKDQIRALNCCGNECVVRKVRQDNSKFTLFKSSEIVWNQGEVSSASSAAYLQPNSYGKPDPAISTYNRYRQREDLSTQVGYNAPSTIASEITDELIATDRPINIIGARDSLVVNSTLYKGFPCANYTNFSASSNRFFFNASVVDHLPVGVGTTSVNNLLSVDYLTNYAYVGFKRPDFVETGRLTGAPHGAGINRTLDLSGSGTAVIETQYTYSDEVLLNFKNFFDSQRLYPELLDHATIPFSGTTNYQAFNTTSASLNASFRNEARFLHLGVSTNNSLDEILGNDMYNVSYSSTAGESVGANASDLSTIPLFVYFNNNCSNLTTEQTNGDTDDNLAYGFARKTSAGTIAFVTERIGGIPSTYYEEQGDDQIKTGTRIGYDYHFNAYGNTSIMLSSGYNPLQYYGHQVYTAAPYIRQVYLGANNVLFNFDTVESRFKLSNLHSAEKVGNFYNAGDPNPPANVLAPPPSAQASQDCYKINKPLRYDSWTPDLQPYPQIDIQGSFTAGTQNDFISMNVMLEPSIIYDAHSGVTIADMGVTEELWTQSFWGLLGFEYGQFNSSGSIENIDNINIRFTNNTTNTSGITTNADVTSENSLQFSVNVFGTNLFNPLINSHVDYYNTAQSIRNGPGTTWLSASYHVEPPIIVVADSTTIKAKQLPRKLLRGYYLINSDILDTANYYQLSNPLQTMAICGKYNAANDFIEYSGGGAVFTVTKEKTITSIKTQILDPEGGTAQVGDNSGVIYRIDKSIKTDLNFATNLMAGMYGKSPM